MECVSLVEGEKRVPSLPCTFEKSAVAVFVELVFAAAGFEDDIVEVILNRYLVPRMVN